MATAVAAWPNTINVTNFAEDYSEKFDTNFSEFAPDIGPPKRRRRMSLVSDSLSFSMYLTSAEVESFRIFYSTTLKDGTLPFTFPKPRTGIIEQFIFTGDAPTIKFVDYGIYQVSMTWKSIPNTRASWLLLLSSGVIPSIAPDIFADFTTEGGSDPHYWYAGNRYGSFSAWLGALGGTYSRASTATYMRGGVVFSAASGAPRFPTDLIGNPTGIRLTGAGTNKAIDSNFQGVSWLLGNATLVSNTTDTTAPDGTNHAGKVTDNSTNGAHDIVLFMASGGATINAVNTFSAFMKKGTASHANLIMIDASGGSATVLVDLTTGLFSFGSSGFTSPSASVQPCANGWFRISISAVWSSVAQTDLFIRMSNGTTSTYVGTGSSYYVWGAQLDAGIGFATDYVPTTTVALTQAADALSFPYSLQTLSAFINTINQQNPQTATRYLSTDDAIGFEALVYQDNTYTQAGIYNGTSAIVKAFPSSPINSHKIMVSGSPVGRSITVDGGTPVSDAANMLPNAFTAMRIGPNTIAFGDFKSLAIWNNIVASSADLVRLTT